MQHPEDALVDILWCKAPNTLSPNPSPMKGEGSKQAFGNKQTSIWVEVGFSPSPSMGEGSKQAFGSKQTSIYVEVGFSPSPFMGEGLGRG
jgi:hypothetical protein